MQLYAPPSQALSALREAFADISVGGSTRRHGRIIPGGNFARISVQPTPNISHENPTQIDSNDQKDAMILDQLGSPNVATSHQQQQSDPTGVQPMQGIIPDEVNQNSSPMEAIQNVNPQMLQVTQLNIQQTQVHLQATAPPQAVSTLVPLASHHVQLQMVDTSSTPTLQIQMVDDTSLPIHTQRTSLQCLADQIQEQGRQANNLMAHDQIPNQGQQTITQVTQTMEQA